MNAHVHGRATRRLSLVVLALAALAAFIGVPSAAHAHLMPAAQGTINVVGSGAFVVVAIPVSALHGWDDNHDGHLGIDELKAHLAEVRAEVARRFVVSDGNDPGQTLALDFILSPEHEAPTDRADQVIALEHVDWGHPPSDVRVRWDLFGVADAERQLTLTTTRVDPRTNAKEAEAGVFTPQNPEHRFFRAPWRAFLDYVRVGAEHVLLGADHLLFLLTVIIAGAGARYWLSVVTGFTVAHSVTLGAAMLGIVHLSPHVVEPLIALSIVLMAVNNLVREGRALGEWCFCQNPTHLVWSSRGGTRRPSPKKRGFLGSPPHAGRALRKAKSRLVGFNTTHLAQRVALVCACGLLHGLGFAASMDAMGLDSGHRVLSLVGFNVGVELGQGAFLVVVLATLLVLRRAVPRLAPGRITRAVSVVAIVMGSVWLVQRLRT